MNREELDKLIISTLRSNQDKWYEIGHFLLSFRYGSQNEKQIIRMRIHNALKRMLSVELIERRELSKYEYKWKVK